MKIIFITRTNECITMKKVDTVLVDRNRLYVTIGETRLTFEKVKQFLVSED